MKILEKIKYVKNAASSAARIYDILNSPDFANERYLGEILRYTHSVEKGLSLENVRYGFGYDKIKEAFLFVKKYKQNNGDMKAEPLLMFRDVLNFYLSYHKKKGYSSEKLKEIENIYSELSEELNSPVNGYGGTYKVCKKIYSEEEKKTLYSLFENRHSVREFSKESVDEKDLKEAIRLASRCPSACNRQCYRIHIVDKNDFKLVNNWFDGVGGFADDLDKMLFITGKMSVYRPQEIHQWIVTGSIFAAYLSLSLEIFGIGCCFIQRPVIPNKQWDVVANRIGAASDEQLVCCMGIGSVKEEYVVPISHRLTL